MTSQSRTLAVVFSVSSALTLSGCFLKGAGNYAASKQNIELATKAAQSLNSGGGFKAKDPVVADIGLAGSTTDSDKIGRTEDQKDDNGNPVGTNPLTPENPGPKVKDSVCKPGIGKMLVSTCYHPERRPPVSVFVDPREYEKLLPSKDVIQDVLRDKYASKNILVKVNPNPEGSGLDKFAGWKTPDMPMTDGLPDVINPKDLLGKLPLSNFGNANGTLTRHVILDSVTGNGVPSGQDLAVSPPKLVSDGMGTTVAFGGMNAAGSPVNATIVNSVSGTVVKVSAPVERGSAVGFITEGFATANNLPASSVGNIAIKAPNNTFSVVDTMTGFKAPMGMNAPGSGFLNVKTPF